MICPECGKETNDNKAFCVHCGANLPPGTTGSESPQTVMVNEGGDGNMVSTETIIVGDREPLPPNFGRYRVLREVGRGAMGVVYLARDDRIARNVAIKTLSLDANLSTEDRKEISARFNREAQAAGKLSHTNIVTVYDVGEEEGTFYIAMEYLEGATLTEITAEGPLSIPQATDVIVQVLSALSYAHGHDVVHRDIKPDNIFLLPDGRVKVVDFGIARITSTSTMTQVGQVMGTPGYMSPEQVKGEPVGPPSDIFSVGVLFYELLTGTAAFRSTSATSIMYKIVHEEPEALHLVNPGVPYNLEAVIARACAKNPSARYSDASQMKEDTESGVAPEMAPSPASHDGTVLRTRPIPQEMPVSVPVTTTTSPAVRKKTGLLIGLVGGGVALAAAVAVVVVLLLAGNGVEVPPKMEIIEKPEAPQTGSLDGNILSLSASSEGYDSTHGISYSANSIRDGNPETCWAEGVGGYGEGQYMLFTFNEPVIVREAKAMPGYNKTSNGKDRFKQNGKLREVILTFSDGSSQFITFDNSRGWQVKPLSTPVETTTVKVTIHSVNPGEPGPNWGASADTSVSEFHFEGCTAIAENEYKRKLEEYEEAQEGEKP